MDDYIRISFATSMDELKKGMDRIEKWIGKTGI
jgi:aspartate/methionine/tyrosine aminotransferase